MPRKIASRKKVKPSSAKARPMTPLAIFMKRGQSRPSSKEMVVPETAPTTKRMPVALLHRRASAYQVASRFHNPSPSAAQSNTGNPTPSAAKIIWNDSETANDARAAVRLSIGRFTPLASYASWYQNQRKVHPAIRKDSAGNAPE